MSTSLVLGLAGAAIGSTVGMPGWGWMIGVGIGAAIDYASQPDIQGPRLEDRTVQISSYGAAIPIPFGSYRLAGNVIWPLNFEVDEQSHSESAKGGPETISYTYTATFAVLVCEAPDPAIGILAIPRIWMNKKLVYDADASPSTDPCIGDMRIYLGTETQDPDPLMVARDGSAPAYRGSVYVVFENVELTQSGFGNRPPSCEFEVITNGTGALPDPVVFTDQIGKQTRPAVDPVTKYVWDTGIDTGVYYAYCVDPVTQKAITRVALDFVTAPISLYYIPETASIWVVTTATGTDDPWLEIIPAHPPRVLAYTATPPGTPAAADAYIVAPAATGDWAGHDNQVATWSGSAWSYLVPTEGLSYWVNVSGALFTYTSGTWTAQPLASLDRPASMAGGWSGSIAYDANSGKVLLGSSVFAKTMWVVDPTFLTVDFTLTGLTVHPALLPIPLAGLVLGKAVDGSVADVIKWVSGSTYELHALLTLTSIGNGAVVYDSERERVIFLPRGGGTNFGIYAMATEAFSLQANSESIDAVNGIYHSGRDSIICADTTGPSIVLLELDAQTLLISQSWNYGIDIAGAIVEVPGVNNYIYVAGGQSSKMGTIVYLDPVLSVAPIALSEIVSVLCTRSPFGLDVADIDVSELTDLVDGYLVGQQMTRRAAIEALQPAYFFDGVESDHVLKFVKRGQASAVTIAKDDRAAHEEGSELPPDLAITRGSELELPWMIDVSYMDQARDYQVGTQYDRRITRNANDPRRLDLPIVMSASKAKQVAIVNLYLPWKRTKFSFTTGNAYAKYEPTDVVTLPTDTVSYIARLVSRSDQGNGIIQWGAELEDIAIYTQTGTVPAVTFIPQTIANAGSTVLALMDSAILRDADDDPGYYTAAAGSTAGWPGAQLFASGDTGLTYDPLLAFNTAATMGIAQGALGDFTAGNIFDEGNSVIVTLRPGQTLTSATETQVLNGSNAAVIGALGRWEVFQFKTAALIATDTYLLSGLLRGRRGTEWATGLHQAGDIFVLASTTNWQRVVIGSGEIGVTKLYKAPPFRTLLSAAAAQAFAASATGLKPYAPTEITSVRDASNNLTWTWYRRSRRGYGALNATVPLGEASEAYSIDVYADDTYVTIVDTLTAAGESLTHNANGSVSAYYAATQQTDAGLTPGDPVSIHMHQVSATVGRGYALEATT